MIKPKATVVRRGYKQFDRDERDILVRGIKQWEQCDWDVVQTCRFFYELERGATPVDEHNANEATRKATLEHCLEHRSEARTHYFGLTDPQVRDLFADAYEARVLIHEAHNEIEGDRDTLPLNQLVIPTLDVHSPKDAYIALVKYLGTLHDELKRVGKDRDYCRDKFNEYLTKWRSTTGKLRWAEGQRAKLQEKLDLKDAAIDLLGQKLAHTEDWLKTYTDSVRDLAEAQGLLVTGAEHDALDAHLGTPSGLDNFREYRVAQLSALPDAEQASLPPPTLDSIRSLMAGRRDLTDKLTRRGDVSATVGWLLDAVDLLYGTTEAALEGIRRRQ